MTGAEPIDRACPYCEARVGQLCVTHSGRVIRNHYHAARSPSLQDAGQADEPPVGRGSRPTLPDFDTAVLARQAFANLDTATNVQRAIAKLGTAPFANLDTATNVQRAIAKLGTAPFANLDTATNVQR
ncbi:zinc finger domain-containing protein, partial [Isoptericola sp. NPDC055881]